MRLILLLILFCLPVVRGAAESWHDTLARMPLATNSVRLSRYEPVDVSLKSFLSNDVAKALVFLPGTLDRLAFFDAGNAALPAKPSLLDLINSMTNQASLLVAFQNSLVLVYSTNDFTNAAIKFVKEPKQKDWGNHPFHPLMRYSDRSWDTLHPVFKKGFGLHVEPKAKAIEGWHFYRYSMVGYGLTRLQALEAICLAGKTSATVYPSRIELKLDNRFGN